VLERALADAVVLVHLAFVAFAVAGGLLTLVWRRAPLAHVPAVLWGAFVELSGSACPLTPLENSLRRAAGDSGYGGGFVEHYLVPLVYPPGLGRGAQLGLAAGLLLANAAIYTFVWRWRRRAGSG